MIHRFETRLAEVDVRVPANVIRVIVRVVEGVGMNEDKPLIV